MEHSNYFERFSDWLFLRQIFALGLAFLYNFFFFCHATAKLAPKKLDLNCY